MITHSPPKTLCFLYPALSTLNWLKTTPFTAAHTHIAYNTPPAIPHRQYPTGNTPPAIPYRQYPTGNTPPAIPHRQYPTGNTPPAIPYRLCHFINDDCSYHSRYHGCVGRRGSYFMLQKPDVIAFQWAVCDLIYHYFLLSLQIMNCCIFHQ